MQISPFFFPNVGGVETHLNDLIKYLKKEDIITKVITYQPLVGKDKGKKIEKNDDIEIHRISWVRGLFYKTEKYPLIHFLYLTPYLGLQSYLYMKKFREKIDIIHAHGINAAIAGSVLKKIFKKSLVVSLHVEFNLPPNSLSTKFILSSLKKADYILVLTEKSKKDLIRMGIDKDKVGFYSYWIDQNIFKPQDTQSIRKELEWKERFTVLFVGRLAKEKGIGNLLEVAKKMPDIRFVVAGTGEMDEIVEKASKEYKNIVYLGRILNNELVKYYNASDVLTVPSLVADPKPEYEEGIPRVIIEALSCGLPIIGTDNGGIKEVITRGRIGEVSESSVEGFIFAIKKLSHSPQKLNEYKKRARKYAIERFSPNNGSKIVKTYRDLILQKNIQTKLKNCLERVGDMALKRRAKSIIEGLNLQDGQKILDVGCGDGFYLHLLSSLGINLKLTGADYDSRGLESARRNLGSKKIPLVQADLMKKLPFTSNSFDGVVMSEVAEHLPDDVKGFKEVYRVLKKDGVFVLTVPCQDYPFFWDPINWILQHLFKTHIKEGFWAGIWNQHTRMYKKEQVEKFMKSAGFKIYPSSVLTSWCLPFNHYMVNFVAKLFYANKLPKNLAKGINKFKNNNQPFLIKLIFWLINNLDKLNDLYPKKNGASIFIKARKLQ